MARKSRKQIAVEEPVIESVSSEVFSTAIYARLSVENSGKSEKVDVIANQIEICKSYIAERPYLNLIDTYVDNGRTGTVFDRPEFNRLMNDIRTGRIKCLVVRDLSRFGRDYIEAGTYLERVFPQIGLRFIAIKENYDNFDTDGSGESLIIPLQNMINTLYSKDISRKVSTALKAQMESGEFKKRNLPYGYRWDEEHSNMVFDEETAPIVRKIFQWKIEGLSLPAIADRLDAMNAPNPEFQKYQVGVRTGNATAKKIWNKSSLTTILDNPHYVGDTVLGRTLNAIYKGVKNQHIDREEWIVFPNTHEAIISREDFQKVRELRDAAARTRVEKMERTEEIRATLINLFEDKIVCADCGRKLYFHRKRVDKRKDGAWYAFYECSSSVKIRSSLEVKQKSGEFVGSFAPYGYMKSPENKNQLIVDEAVSEYVQMIFSMYKDGFSIGRIAKRLNQMGVLSPMEYKHSAGVKFDTVFKTGDTAKWTYKAVQRILTNEVYIGVLAQGKRGTPNYKVRVVKSKDESEWVKVENAHEALVSYEDFMAVKVMMQRDMRCSPDQDEAHLFSGFLFCGDCQQPMIRKTVPSKTKKYIYYVCSTNKHSRTCSPHSIAAKEVEEKVFRAIHDQIELVINLEHALAMIERLPSQSRKAFNYEAQIAKIEEEIERYQKLKLGLYENFIGGVIDKSEYFEFRNSYTKIIEDKQEALLRVKKEMKQTVTTGTTERNWVTLFKQYENVEELNRRVLMSLVDRILIHENHAIEIVFKYRDEYQQTIEYVLGYADELDIAV